VAREALEDQNGKRYVAPFPEDVTRPVQPGFPATPNDEFI